MERKIRLDRLEKRILFDFVGSIKIANQVRFSNVQVLFSLRLLSSGIGEFSKAEEKEQINVTMGLFSNDDFNHDPSCNRGSEREDLLRQIKILSDKVQRSNEALKREESEKHHERMIMSKTHETQLEIKNSLIRNLEDIIDEQEARIFHLQSHVNGIGPLSPRASKPLGGVTRLRDEIEELAKRNIELSEALLKEQHLRQKLSEEDSSCRYNGNGCRKSTDAISCQAHLDCESKLAQSEKEKGKWKAEAQVLKIKLDQLENDHQQLRLDYERLDVKCSEQSLEADRKQREYQVCLAAEKEKHENALIALKRDMDQMRSQDNSCNVETEQVEVKLQQARDALMNAENQNRTLRAAAVNFDLASARNQAELRRWKVAVEDLEKEVERSTDTLEELKSKHRNEVDRLKASISRTRRESTTWQQRHADAVIALDCFRASLKFLRQEQLELVEMASTLPSQIESRLSDVTDMISSRVVDTMGDLASRYKKEILLRKRYHNQLVELKGNIRVFARVRPVLPFDAEQLSVIELDDVDDTILSVDNNGRKQIFNLDKVFGPQHTQADVFTEVRPLITSVLDGYNICIFAYGQTGSGKTYTMDGINQRALACLFDEVSSTRGDWQFDITVSMLEIYNEAINDLLSVGPDSDKLDVKMNADGYLYVPGLTCVEVGSLLEVNRVFQMGRENRATASTNMNEHSSRSHALLCVNVAGIHRTTSVKTQGRLNLVDLAGSERVSKSAACGDRLKEAQCINKSLSALGDVIWALKNQHQHIPFRNSKLTYLLQDSLAGNSKTLMVVQVAPVANHVGETVCSLNFGQRVRSVELGPATASRTPGPAANNGSSGQEESSGNSSPFVRTPSKNFKARNGWR